MRRPTHRPPILRTALVASAVLAAAPIQADDPGLGSRTSPYPVSETLDRLEVVLRGKGVEVFARIDHAAAAREAGLELAPTELLVFGNPKAGTPLMQAAPTVALDLPMKVLAWQDPSGQVQVLWNSPDFLVARHGLDPDAAGPLGAVKTLVDAALD